MTKSNNKNKRKTKSDFLMFQAANVKAGRVQGKKRQPPPRKKQDAAEHEETDDEEVVERETPPVTRSRPSEAEVS